MKIAEDVYLEAVENDEGWCTTCKRFTAAQCEPDARGYTCPDCDNPTVYGAEEALMMGEIEFSEDEDE